MELGAAGNPGSSDRINVTLANGLTLTGGTVNLTDAGGLGAGTYRLIDYSGTLIYTKGKIHREGGEEYFYVVISAKISAGS